MSILLSFVARFVPHASAASLPGVLCSGNLPGCGEGPANVLKAAVNVGFMTMLDIAAAGAVLGAVVSGLFILSSLGDESKVTKGRQGILYSAGGLAVALSSRAIVSFIVTETWAASGGSFIPTLFGTLVRIVVAVTQAILVLVILWAGFSMVMASGKPDEFKKATNMIKWAIVGALVVGLGKAIIQGLFTLGISW